MKNVYLYMVFLLMSFNSFGQGVDVIFVIDNTSSIIGDVNDSTSEYGQIYNSIQQLMSSTLNCNSDNRITVMQFYEGYIYLESTFTNNVFTFSRRWNGCCTGMPESLNILANALNGIISSSVQSPVKTLSPTPGNKLVLYFFTDAGRGSDLLIGSPPIGSNNNSGFVNYTNFKNNFDAKFFMSIKAPDINALKAAASIASVGGDYNSVIEPYAADPDGAGTLPRCLLNVNSFLFSGSQLQLVTDQICSLGCVSNLILTSTANDVIAPVQDLRQAQNTIMASNIVNNGAVGIYHAGDDLLLKSGFHSASGSVFRGYIEGCSNQYAGLSVASQDESMRMADSEAISKELFTLYPNPAKDRATVISDRVMTNITVTGLDGYALFKSVIKGNSYDLNIADYPKGFYIITVTTESGETEMKKLIKN